MDGDASLGQTRPDRAYPVQALPRSIDHLYIYNRAVGRLICVYESQLSWLEVIPVLLECIEVVPIIQIYPPIHSYYYGVHCYEDTYRVEKEV